MALVRTTLAADVASSDLSLKVTAATNLAVGMLALCDSEYIGAITSISGTVIGVRGRGDQGTAAAAHDNLAAIDFGIPSDFPTATAGTLVARPPQIPDTVMYGENGAIAVPTKDTRVILDKASAATMTIGDPSKASDGIEVTIVAATAAAHTVANTTGYNAGGTTVDTATFGGAIGDNFTIMAVGGTWVTTNTVNVTLGLWALLGAASVLRAALL